jgi:HK97 family phage major capsid protein
MTEIANTRTPSVSPNIIQLARSARVAGVRNFTGAGVEVRAYRFAQWFIAGPLARLHDKVDPSEMMTRAEAFCRQQGVPLVRAHGERDNEAGGFLVPDEFIADFIDLRERFGVFRRNARVVRMGSASQSSLRRRGGLKAYPIGVADRQITESQARWDGIHLEARKWGVLTKYEAELSEDSITNFGDELAGEMAYAFSQSEDECGFIGDATSLYNGISGVIPRLVELDETVANVAGLVEATGATWDSITREDMLAVVERLPEYADTPETKWYCSRKFYVNVMMRIMLEAGGVTAAQLESMRVKMFMHYPVEIAQVLPKKSAASQVPCLFGDLRQAARFGDRRQISVDVTDSNRTEFEDDVLTIRGTERFDINVHDVGNASADEDEREAGPVVGLITKSS